MQITRQADYAVRAVVQLAKAGNGQQATTSRVAREQNIPPSFLSKIISQLVIVGIVHTTRGAHGGIILARDPNEITLLEVIEAVEGPIQLNRCVGTERECTFGENCPIKSMWCNLQEEFVNRLKGINFGDLLVKNN